MKNWIYFMIFACMPLASIVAQDFTVTAPFTSPVRNTCTATEDCSLSSTREHIYEVIIPESGQWLFSLCGAAFDTHIFVGTSVCSQDIGNNDDSCGLASELAVNIPAGTYYVTVEGFETTDCGEYILRVEEYMQDFTVTAPFVSPVRNTCYAENNCALSSSSEHIYEVVIPESGQWLFSLCGAAAFDTHIFIGTSACSQDIGSNDDGCDFASELTVDIPAGTYYVTLEGFDAFECGYYILTVVQLNTDYTPDYSVTVPYTSPIRNTCTANNNCSRRFSPDHTYEVVIPSNGDWVFSLCGADFDTYLFVGTSPCLNDIGSNDDECDFASELTVNIPAGTYYVTIEGFDSTDCGEYIFRVEELMQDFTVTAPFVSPARRTCAAEDNCALSSSPDHTYEVEIPSSGDWVFSLCGAAFDTYLFVGTSPCSDDIGSNDDSCDVASQLIVNISEGTYYVNVEGFDSSDCGEYTLSVEPFNVDYAPDYTVTAPYISPVRNTCTANNNCILSFSPEHTYEVVVPTTGQWLFSLCGAGFDTYMYIGTSLCLQDIGSNDDECDLASELTVNIPAGTYYVMVEGYDSFECGQYTLNIELITSVDDIQSNTFKVYPNPTRDLINIEKNISQNVSYQILDVLGKNIVTGVLTEDQTTINISSLINGVYFLKMADQTVKLIKQ